MSRKERVELQDVIYQQFLTLDSLLHAANRLIPEKPATDEIEGVRYLVDAAERLFETTRDRICNLLAGIVMITNTKITVRHNANFEITDATIENHVWASSGSEG